MTTTVRSVVNGSSLIRKVPSVVFTNFLTSSSRSVSLYFPLSLHTKPVYRDPYCRVFINPKQGPTSVILENPRGPQYNGSRTRPVSDDNQFMRCPILYLDLRLLEGPDRISRVQVTLFFTCGFSSPLLESSRSLDVCKDPHL